MRPKTDWHISKSALGMWLDCPYGFYLNYHKHCEALPWRTTIWGDWGTFVHNEFAEFFPKVDDDKLVDDPLQNVEYFRTLLPEHKVFEDFSRFEAARYQMQSDCWRPKMTEKRLQEEKYKTMGYIDRLDQGPDDTVIPFEYKSRVGRWKGLKWELAFYTLILQQQGYKIDYVAAYGYTDSNYVIMPIEEEIFDEIIAQLKQLRADRTYKKRNQGSWRCKDCGHFLNCYGSSDIWNEHPVEELLEI